jgi:hypothetical protein
MLIFMPLAYEYIWVFKMNNLWENLYKAASDLVDQIDVDGTTDTAERSYQNLCVALDAITAKKNEEAFNK